MLYINVPKSAIRVRLIFQFQNSPLRSRRRISQIRNYQNLLWCCQSELRGKTQRLVPLPLWIKYQNPNPLILFSFEMFRVAQSRLSPWTSQWQEGKHFISVSLDSDLLYMGLRTVRLCNSLFVSYFNFNSFFKEYFCLWFIDAAGKW